MLTELVNNGIKKSVPVLQVDSLKLPYYFDDSKVRQALSFEPRSDDIFLVTYPKCGTVWMTYILWSIKNHGKTPLPELADLNKDIPYLERSGKNSRRKAVKLANLFSESDNHRN